MCLPLRVRLPHVRRERERAIGKDEQQRRCSQLGTPYAEVRSISIKSNSGKTGGDWHLMFDLDANLTRIAPVSAFKCAPLRDQMAESERILAGGDHRLIVDNRHYDYAMTEQYKHTATYWPCRVAFLLGMLACFISLLHNLHRLQGASPVRHRRRYIECHEQSASLRAHCMSRSAAVRLGATKWPGVGAGSGAGCIGEEGDDNWPARR